MARQASEVPATSVGIELTRMPQIVSTVFS